MIPKEDGRSSGRGTGRILMVVASLLGCAALFSLQYGRPEGEPMALWTAATARAPGFTARASPAAQQPRMALRGMNVPQAMYPSKSYGMGAKPLIIVRADDLEESIKKMIVEQLSVDA